MHQYYLLESIAFAAVVGALPTLSSWHDIPNKHYSCSTHTVSVDVVNATVVNVPSDIVKNQYEATSLVLNDVTIRTPSTTQPQLTDYSATINIFAEYCTPVASSNLSKTLQILTHGLGFNRSYWDFYLPSSPEDDQYSYISAATAAGYSTFSYNRVGIDVTPSIDPITDVQTQVELAVLAGISKQAKNGSLPGLTSVPEKVVHVGHSWGSQLSNALAAAHPELSDGIVLTGYSPALQYQPLFIANSNLLIASVANSSVFPSAKYSSGYVTWPSVWSNQYAFFAYPNFDPRVLEIAESTKQPYTIGEILSAGLFNYNATEFTKPVFWINGAQDLIFCASNCTGLFGTDSGAYTHFPKASVVDVKLVPDFGHGMNLHYNASKLVFEPIMNWLGKNGY